VFKDPLVSQSAEVSSFFGVDFTVILGNLSNHLQTSWRCRVREHIFTYIDQVVVKDPNEAILPFVSQSSHAVWAGQRYARVSKHLRAFICLLNGGSFLGNAMSFCHSIIEPPRFIEICSLTVGFRRLRAHARKRRGRAGTTDYERRHAVYKVPKKKIKLQFLRCLR